MEVHRTLSRALVGQDLSRAGDCVPHGHPHLVAAPPLGLGAGPGVQPASNLRSQLCALADTQDVTLDLIARSPALVERYNRLGFTQPHPDQLRLVRPPR